MTCETPLPGNIQPVPLEQTYLLFNHGPATLASARYDGITNVMAASWVCGLDTSPPKLTAVLGRESKTRELAEKSGYFVIQIPTAAQLELVYQAGHRSGFDDPEKLQHCGIELQRIADVDLPFIAGCSAWLICKIIPVPENQNTYDLFIAEIVGAWADQRVFSAGRWKFEIAAPALRSLHYIAGGRFYAIGEELDANSHELTPGASQPASDSNGSAREVIVGGPIPERLSAVIGAPRARTTPASSAST
ncbi:NAD(P)H-flavin oxidoreductase [Burkholderia sp. AU4i]|jgi:flavin reductase (DIM6/NTAB) family NADH-FMN oxidoreductase RutF|nr:NAD(P)H-flavin oxidoreductase [Burkholderia sp. AU4i]